MSRLPQIEWRGDTLDFGFMLGLCGQLRVGKRLMRHAATFKRPENTLKAAEVVEARLWALNYEQTLRELKSGAPGK